MRAEGFSCRFDGLGISKNAIFEKFSALFFFKFLVIKTPDPDLLETLTPDSMNPDPQHCLGQKLFVRPIFSLANEHDPDPY